MYKQYLPCSLIILLFLLVSSCKPSLKLNDDVLSKAPDQFISGNDSSKLSVMSWRSFFKDSVLVALIDTALRNNQDARIALQRLNANGVMASMSKAALLPSFQLQARAGQERFGDYTMNGVGNFDTNLSDNIVPRQRIPSPTPDFFLGGSTSWEIDLWGKLSHQRKRDHYLFLASEQGRRVIQTSIVHDVAFHYYELLALDEELDIIRKNITLQSNALQLVEIQKSAGKLTEAAVAQSKAQLLNTQALEFSILQMITEHENMLCRLMGRFSMPVVRSRKLDDQILHTSATPGLPYLMMTRRPDVVEARMNWFASASNMMAAKRAFYPTLNLSAFAGLNAFSTEFLFSVPQSLAHGITSGLVAPIFNRRQIKGSYRMANAREREAYLEYEKKVIAAYQEVMVHTAHLENLEQALTLKNQEVNVLSGAVGNMNELFSSGYSSYLEVITAQSNLLKAELDAVILKRTQMQTLASMYRSLGGGWE